MNAMFDFGTVGKDEPTVTLYVGHSSNTPSSDDTASLSDPIKTVFENYKNKVNIMENTGK